MARKYPPLDLTRFDGMLKESAVCYSLDLVYGINMVRMANVIQKKRDSWALRLEYRRLAGGPVPWAEGWSVQNAVEVLSDHDHRADT